LYCLDQEKGTPFLEALKATRYAGAIFIAMKTDSFIEKQKQLKKIQKQLSL